MNQLQTVQSYWEAMEAKLKEFQSPDEIEALRNIFYSGAAAYYNGVKSVLEIEDRAVGKAALDALEAEVNNFFNRNKPEPSRIIVP